jgi:hypothetical protein
MPQTRDVAGREAGEGPPAKRSIFPDVGFPRSVAGFRSGLLSIGIPTQGADVIVVDDVRYPFGPIQYGEIVVRGPGVMARYGSASTLFYRDTLFLPVSRMKLVEVIPTFGKQLARTPWITSANRYAVILRHRRKFGVAA